MTKPLRIFAPAKVNLYLHITGKLTNGYHMLDSLAGFVDVGDYITIENSDEFSFVVEGPYKDYFSDRDLDSSDNSGNLVVRAARNLAKAVGRDPLIKITLEKNLPLASGIGGGSSDAGACIWGLMEWWGISPAASFLPSLLLEMGTDIPVCLKCQPSHMAGLGDLITPLKHALPEVPIVLANPSVHCSTIDVYKRFKPPFSDLAEIPDHFHNVDEFIQFLQQQSNDLTPPAIAGAPSIETVLEALKSQDGSLLSRMSGSGATCFALFRTQDQANEARQAIQDHHPDWWVKSGFLNRPQRY